MAVLAEYGSIDLNLTRAQAEAFQRSGFVDVSPAPGEGWRVTAKAYVGSLVVDGIALLIRPKIKPENVFLLLEPGLPPQAWRNEAFAYDSTSDLLPSFIAFFARTVETTLGRGVLRSYHNREDSLVALRGRLDVAAQFKRAGLLSPVACSYDEFSEDVVENRALRAAMRHALRVPGARATDRQRLMSLLITLENVKDTNIRPQAIDSIPMTRLNQHYGPALRLARLLLANLTLSDAHGATSTQSFMVDMNDLFQRFVTERLRRQLRGKLDVIDEPTIHLGTGRDVAMQPDLVFRNLRGDVCYVGDVKYKVAAGARGRSEDYYQLLAYTTAMDLPEGVLIYCRREAETPGSIVTARNSNKRLVLYCVDLSGSAAQVEQEIAGLANTIARATHQGPIDTSPAVESRIIV